MLMSNDNFKNREQKIINNISKSIDEIKVSMGAELVSYAKANSVTQSSIDYINGNSNIDPNIYDAGSEGMENVNAKKLVRTLGVQNPGFVPREEVVNNNVDNSYNSSYNQVSNDYSQNPWSLGSATTLILIFTAILVAMVALFSFMVLNYIGF